MHSFHYDLLFQGITDEIKYETEKAVTKQSDLKYMWELIE